MRSLVIWKQGTKRNVDYNAFVLVMPDVVQWNNYPFDTIRSSLKWCWLTWNQQSFEPYQRPIYKWYSISPSEIYNVIQIQSSAMKQINLHDCLKVWPICSKDSYFLHYISQGVKVCLWHYGRNIVLGCLRTGCWG